MVVPTCDRHLPASSKVKGKAHIISSQSITDTLIHARMPDASTSRSALTLAHICVLACPDDWCVSHILAMLHLCTGPLCQWTSRQPSHTWLAPFPPSPLTPASSHDRSSNALYPFHCTVCSLSLDASGVAGHTRATWRPLPSDFSLVACCGARCGMRRSMSSGARGGELLWHCRYS